VPTACADFPKEIIWAPRRSLETRFNITRWTVMPRGGHLRRVRTARAARPTACARSSGRCARIRSGDPDCRRWRGAQRRRAEAIPRRVGLGRAALAGAAFEQRGQIEAIRPPSVTDLHQRQQQAAACRPDA